MGTLSGLERRMFVLTWKFGTSGGGGGMAAWSEPQQPAGVNRLDQILEEDEAERLATAVNLSRDGRSVLQVGDLVTIKIHGHSNDRPLQWILFRQPVDFADSTHVTALRLAVHDERHLDGLPFVG